MKQLSTLFALAALGLAAVSLTGCTMETTAAPAQIAIPAMQGTVMGGETPIAGSSIILWETDNSPTATYGSTGGRKLGTATGSTPGGSFSFTTGYTCDSNQFVYLTSTGGDVSNGSATPMINNNIVFMAALGSCSNFATAAAQGATRVIVNELTTVAAAYTLDNFMTVGASTTGNQPVYIGAPLDNNSSTGGACAGTGSAMTCSAAGLSHAFANAANLASASNIGGNGGPSGLAYTTVPGNTQGSVPQAEINTLGDIVSYCTNSPGGVAGDGSACGTFFTEATPPGGTAPADTLSALINIARFPRNNVGTTCTGSSGGLFCLVPSTAAFQPDLATAPHDWSLAIAYSGTNIATFGNPDYLTLDANDNVYVQTATTFAGTSMGMAAMTSNGTGIWNNATTPTQCIPGTVATDTNGYVWDSIEASSTSGCPAAVYGYSAAAGGAPVYSYTTSSTPAIPSQVNALAFDRLNNLWFGRKSTTCTSLCLAELPFTAGTGGAAGTYATAANAQVGPLSVNQIMIDTRMNIWAGNAVTSGTGALYVLANQSPSTPNAPTYIASPGYVSVALPFDDNGGIALDSLGNIFSGSNDSVSEYTPMTTAGVVTSFGTATTTTSTAGKPYAGEVDGNGLYWYGSYSQSGDIFYQITPSSSLYSATASTNTNDIQPCYVPAGTTTCNGTLPAEGSPAAATYASSSPRVVQVDSTGALWVAAPGASGSPSGFVLQVFGQANPTWPQLSYGVFATKPQ